MSIRIPCWYQRQEIHSGRNIFIIPDVDLTQILHHDTFYSGKYVKILLVNHFAEKKNLDLNKINKAIKSVREDSLTFGRDENLRPSEETKKLVICFFGAGLDCYYPDSTDMFIGDYLETVIRNLEIDVDNFKSFLRSNGLPLPSYLFPDEKDNTLLFEGRLHNKKGLKEILSLYEIKNIVKHPPIKNVNHRNKGGLLPIITEYELNWNEITITFLDDNTIHIQFKKDSESRRYNQAGFVNVRTGLPIKAWEAWYSAAKTFGLKTTFNNRRLIEKRAQEIRKRLKILFPNVKGNPLIYNRKERIYTFAFQQNPPQE